MGRRPTGLTLADAAGKACGSAGKAQGVKNAILRNLLPAFLCAIAIVFVVEVTIERATLAVFGVGFVAVLAWLVFREQEHQRRRRELEDFILNNPERMGMTDDAVNVFYLRSFLLDELMIAGAAEHIDRALIYAGRGVCRFFALGEQNQFGIRMKRTTDRDWFEAFRTYSAHADIIVITPFATRSTTREFQHLIDKHIGKTLIYVPQARIQTVALALFSLPFLFLRRLYFTLFVAPKELPKDFPRRTFLYRGYLEEVWAYSRETLRDRVDLPAYADDGALWSLAGQRGRVVLGTRFELDPDKIRAAFLQCLSGDRLSTSAANELARIVSAASKTHDGRSPEDDHHDDDAEDSPSDAQGESSGSGSGDVAGAAAATAGIVGLGYLAGASEAEMFDLAGPPDAFDADGAGGSDGVSGADGGGGGGASIGGGEGGGPG